MKEVIEQYLTKVGYTEIEWRKGRDNFYYIMARKGVFPVCIDLIQIVYEILRLEFKDIPNLDSTK